MTTAVPNDTRAKTAKQLRRLRVQRLAIRLTLGVGVPTLVAAIYYGSIATPRYESTTTFTIQTAEGHMTTSALAMLMSSVPGTASRDVLLVQEYVRSRDMLEYLIEEHGFLEHYRNANADWFSRLGPDAPFEKVYEYYLDHVHLEHDSMSGVLTLSVQAFDSETATRLGQAILDQSEHMVNRLSEQARQDQIELAQRELDRAEARLSKARQSLSQLQSERGDLNPLASATAILEVRSRLEGELAISRAEVSTLAATMPRAAPEVVAARRRVTALQEQIDIQNGRLSGGTGDEGLNADLAQFEPVVIEKEFAQRAYSSALASLELSRVDASRQHRYLVRIAGPSHPDQASFPRFWYSVLTVLVLAFAILGIGTLLIASVREHANV